MATLRKKKLNVAKLQAVFNGVSEDTFAAVKQAGELVLERAIPITPKSKNGGALRRSGRVEVEGNLDKIKVKVVFGNNDTVDYAAIVHEDMEETKNFTELGTGPKYLESAVNMSIEDIEALFQSKVRESFQKRGKV